VREMCTTGAVKLELVTIMILPNLNFTVMSYIKVVTERADINYNNIYY